MDWAHLFFAFNGRIGRNKYWLAVFVCAVIYLVLYIVAHLTESAALGALSGMITIVLFISLLAIGTKRLHDRNKSGWYLVLFYIVPGILLTACLVIGTVIEDSLVIAGVLGLAAFGFVIWTFVEMGCLQGTAGPNQYGPDPLAPAALPPPARTPA